MKSYFIPTRLRKKYLVHPHIQLGPVWRSFLVLLVPMLAIDAFFFYDLTNGTLTLPNPAVKPLFELAMAFTLCILLLTTTVGVWTALYLHRVCGGLKRAERHLEEFCRTGRWEEVHLRRNDLIKDFMNKLNRALSAASKGEYESRSDG